VAQRVRDRRLQALRQVEQFPYPLQRCDDLGISAQALCRLMRTLFDHALHLSLVDAGLHGPACLRQAEHICEIVAGVIRRVNRGGAGMEEGSLVMDGRTGRLFKAKIPAHLRQLLQIGLVRQAIVWSC
jgi:hypothetical protein